MTTIPSDDAALLSKMLQADGLPGIVIANRPWRDLATEAVAHLVHTRTPIYVRHGQLVRIQRTEDGTPFIETLTETMLKNMAARAMNVVKLTAKGPQHIAPPDGVVKDILALGSWPFPPIESIIEFPVFRPDGSLIDTPGYDAVTRLYYAPLPTLTIPHVPDHPTDDDLIAAQALIYEIIGEFPYDGEASYANAVALLLTPIIRQSINGHVPLALIDATRPGTGKSLLAETVAMIATGRKAAMMTAPYDDDEWRKRIAATLAEGATIITIDNLKAKLQAASLDAALTSFTVKERILGLSKNGVYAQRATWMVTGNNIQIGGDLPRRSYWIRMDAGMDKPWTRGPFTHDLEDFVPAHRGELIAALLTLARAWFAAGRPPAPIQHRMGSFQPWVDTISGILAHCWVPAFLGNLATLHEQGDDDALQWAAFLHAWHDFYQDKEVRVSQLAKDIKSGTLDDGNTTLGVAGLYNALPDDLSDTSKGDFKRRLGKALAAHVGAHFDGSGLHLTKTRTDRSGTGYWMVAEVQKTPKPIPQKEENLFMDTPSEQEGGGLREEILLEKKIRPGEITSATSAHLRGVVTQSADENGQRWQHLQLFDAVTTSKGEGVVIQNHPRRVVVRLDTTLQEVAFDDPDDIRQIQPLTFGAYRPNAWPYNDPSWTDDMLLEAGYLIRSTSGLLMPRMERFTL